MHVDTNTRSQSGPVETICCFSSVKGHGKSYESEDLSRLTSTDTLQRIEEGHKKVHEHSQVEGDAAPE